MLFLHRPAAPIVGWSNKHFTKRKTKKRKCRGPARASRILMQALMGSAGIAGLVMPAFGDGFEGQWNTRFGDVTIVQENQRNDGLSFFYGKYRDDLGFVGGFTDGQTARGVFTHSDTTNGKLVEKTNNIGTFIWVLEPGDEAFSGTWRWGTSQPTQSGDGAWTGTRRSSDRPEISRRIRFWMLGHMFQAGSATNTWLTSGRIESDPRPTPQPNPPSPPLPEAEERIQGSKVFVEKKGRSTEQKPAGPPRTFKTGAGYSCTVNQQQVTARFDETFMLATTEQNIYPGAIINGRSYAQGGITPVSGQRAPINIALGGGPTGSRRVNDATASSVSQAVNLMLPTSLTEPQANLAYEESIIRSESDLRLFLKAGYDNGITKVKGNGEFKTNNRENTVYVKAYQIYYSAFADVPSNYSQASFFSDRTAITSDMLMIDKVLYGRMLLFRVDTKYSAEKISAAIAAADTSTGGTITAEAETEANRVLSESKVSVVAMGGTASNAMKTVTGGLPEIKNYLRDGVRYSRNNPGVPLAYTVRFLASMEPANVGFTSNVSTTDCAWTNGRWKVSFEKICVVSVDDPLDDGWDEEEIYGIGWASARIWDRDDRKMVTVRDIYGGPRAGGLTGRIWERNADNYHGVGAKSCMSIGESTIFDLDAKAYGYGTVEDMLADPRNAFSVTLEVKEWDRTSTNDNFGKVDRKIPLAQANVCGICSEGTGQRESDERKLAGFSDTKPGVWGPFSHGSSQAKGMFIIEPYVD